MHESWIYADIKNSSKGCTFHNVNGSVKVHFMHRNIDFRYYDYLIPSVILLKNVNVIHLFASALYRPESVHMVVGICQQTISICVCD